MASVFVELQTPLSEYSLVCRGCLAESGEMKNMREWGLTEDFCKQTDVKLQTEFGISELLCTSCEDSLMMSMRFRSQCQQSDAVLKNIAQKKSEASLPERMQNTVSYTFDEHQLIFTVQAPDTESKINLPCPYNCAESYIKKKDLLIHLTKSHNQRRDFKIDVKYFCFHTKCPYNEATGKRKWFAKRKVLNAHYNKVHKSKIFDCSNCNLKFSLLTDYNRHLKTCNVLYKCDLCNLTYNSNERLMVHLMRHHPVLHKQYKNARKEKRKSNTETNFKRIKTDYLSDSPKRSFATQTFDNIKNDVILWTPNAKTDEISTQTVFDDLLSLKSQSEDDSILFSETVSLSDIQTQTFPIEFKQSVSNKETITDPDISAKSQTCVCRYDSPKFRLFDSVTSSPSNFISTETQTIEFKTNLTDVLLNFNSAETQTCFDSELDM